MSEERLVEIETRIAYNELTLTELSDIVCAQHKQIDKLEKICRKLAEQLGSVTEPVSGNSILEEKPPHY